MNESDGWAPRWGVRRERAKSYGSVFYALCSQPIARWKW